MGEETVPEDRACPECGAPLPASGSCRDHFHAMLALEWQVPGGAGGPAHFYAVSSYILQHPGSMEYAAASIAWLRSAVAASLAGDTTIAGLRESAPHEGKANGRVTRRPGDAEVAWPGIEWRMTVADVLEGGVDGYGERVELWARRVLADLDAAGA